MTDQKPAFEVLRRDQIREGYGTIAQGGCCCSPDPTAGCCAPAADADALAAKIGYSRDELDTLPAGVNLGLSCGNPTAIAGLAEGEVVVDLGSGAGFDVFLASPKVGATGRVIGVDMTAEMLAKARGYDRERVAKGGLDNVEFRLGEIEHLPIADGTVDAILSNCVLNLSTDKPQVWREIGRVLKPGGRVMASDIALFRELPDELRADANSWIGCVGGAVLIDEYRALIEAAGLVAEKLEPKPDYVETLVAGGDPFYAKIASYLPEGVSPAEYITSLDVLARKP